MQTETNIGSTSSSLNGYQASVTSLRDVMPEVPLGLVHWLDESGRVRQSWSVCSDYITIGSSSGCSISIDEMGLELVHGAISFGKNHILVQAIEGLVRIGGRQIREWLIDEPTVGLFGLAKLQIVPFSFMKEETFASYRVTPGSVSDQAARLQNLHTEPPKADPLSKDSYKSSERIGDSSVAESLESSISASTQAATIASAQIVQQHVASEVSAALEPIRDSLDAIRSSVVDGLRELSTNLVDRYEQRFIETSAVIDHRFERIESLLTSSHIQPTEIYKDQESSDSLHEYTSAPTDLYALENDSYHTQFPENEPVSQLATFQSEAALASQAEASEQPIDPVLDNEQAIAPQNYFVNDWQDKQPSYKLSPEEDSANQYQYIAENFTENPHGNSNGSFVDNSLDENDLDIDAGKSSENDIAYTMPSGSLYPEEQLGALYPETNLAELDSDNDTYSAGMNEPYSDNSMQSESELPAWFLATQEKSEEVGDYSVDPYTNAQQSTSEEPLSYAREILPVDYGYEAAEDSHKLVQESQFNVDNSTNSIDINESFYKGGIAANEYGESAANNSESLTSYAGDSEQNAELEDEAQYVASQLTIQPASESEESSEYLSSSSAQAMAADEEEEEESIEVYMQRLLQRVKGEGTTSSSTNPSAGEGKKTRSEPNVVRAESIPEYSAANEPVTTSTTKTTSQIKSRGHSSDTEEVGMAAPPTTKVIRNVPRVSVEQQQESLAALRELANHTARRAINHNTKKRIEGFLYGKLMISGAGLLGGTILLFINGLTPNVAMAGMICAYAVFLLWGYDAWCHSRRLLATKNEDEVEQV